MFDPDYKYTLAEYWRQVEAFPEHKYEYIDGSIRMMTGGTLAHAQIGANVTRIFGNALLDQECNVYNSDAVVKLAEGRLYCPDVSISCDPADWTRKVIESPTIVVEVISPSTEKADRSEKLEAYKRFPTIQEILLIDSRRCYVEYYHRTGSTKWENILYEHPNERIELQSSGVPCTLKEIYQKVYLELEENPR